MKFNRQEQTVVINTFISMLGKDIMNECIDKKKLEGVVPNFNELEDNTTSKQRRKAMDEFLVTDE
ncbi:MULTISPECIES: hypothetical protein [Bacillus cereus group]|uniref:hypothetical protein n=1 Tax=Bacillus cereus group TaxID=86661 RepID=UPI0007FB5391|nr:MULTISPECIES: hypothetical protein [Bacillus cereus group]MCP1394364.1 hypothetical protein [Bacillus cereus]MCR6786188.1 hypothetical protein [Bacillus thuringiensis]MCR6826388.1 hypothetical protein [Bacillus thuringiensis]MCR6832317.1 hypothetical protein [Bacillus thuringiensis]MEB8929859.1 hypothetical protein [Bacillus cereus]